MTLNAAIWYPILLSWVQRPEVNRGYSLVEILIVLAATAILAAISMPRLGPALDRLAVERAVRETVAFYRRARAAAVMQSTPVQILLRSDSLVARLEGSARDSVLGARQGVERFGVDMFASRSIVRIFPNGLGRGAANATLVFVRGRARDSVAISRLGRVRRLP